MEVLKIDKKILAVSLVVLAVFAAAVSAFAMTTLASTNSNANNVVADNVVTNDQSTTTTTSTTDTTLNQPFFGGSLIERGFGGGPRQHRLGGIMGGITVSAEYTANVNAILGNDTDVASLTAQGYNVTRIMPEVKTVIDGNGAITTQATTATVLMQGTSGYATVHVDIANSKVTQIVTVTRTVINK